MRSARSIRQREQQLVMSKREVKVRSMIVAPKGHVLVSWDLSQAESWIVAFLANEPNMKRALRESDIHLETAAVIFNQSKEELLAIKKLNPIQFKMLRYIAKQQNHAKAYRESYQRAAQVINKYSDEPPYAVVTYIESELYHNRWHSHYNVKTWWREIEQQLDFDRTLITPYGRRRVFFQAWGNELFKEATAYVPQSTVADHLNGRVQKEVGIEGGLLTVYKRYGKLGAFWLNNQSHDSIIAEVPTELYRDILEPVTQLLRRPLVVRDEEFTIPVSCEVGERWGELEEVKV